MPQLCGVCFFATTPQKNTTNPTRMRSVREPPTLPHPQVTAPLMGLQSPTGFTCIGCRLRWAKMHAWAACHSFWSGVYCFFDKVEKTIEPHQNGCEAKQVFALTPSWDTHWGLQPPKRPLCKDEIFSQLALKGSATKHRGQFYRGVCSFFDEVEKRTHPTRMGLRGDLCPLALPWVNCVEDTPRYSVVLQTVLPRPDEKPGDLLNRCCSPA